jgi:hypothetical protein
LRSFASPYAVLAKRGRLHSSLVCPSANLITPHASLTTAEPSCARETHVLHGDRTPLPVLEILQRGQVEWLKNTEVHDLLTNYKGYDLTVSRDAPLRPPGARRPCMPGAAQKKVGR